MAMLCCVSRKAAAGSNDNADSASRCRASAELSRFVEVCRDLNKAREDEDEALRRLDEAVLDVTVVANSFTTFRKLETLPEEVFDCYDAQPEVLLPCAVCGRKFNPRSLDKHVKICERTACKKRKPFDSAKQRIQGTELAEFLPKHGNQQQSTASPASQYDKEHTNIARSTKLRCDNPINIGEYNDRTNSNRKPNTAWKQTRDEFLRAIRAARGDVSTTSQSQQQHNQSSQQQQSQSNASLSSPQSNQHNHNQQQQQQQRPSTLSLVTSPGAPTRSNEKGTCPTCQRQFGVKAYDRHVEWCKEKARLPASPQTSNNVAKERLEARMKYRAPALRNKKPTNREKYSPGGGGAQKAMLTSPLLGKKTVKSLNASATSIKSNDTASPKLPMLKRSVQTTKESPVTSSGPLKSRPMDRSNSGQDYNPFLLAEQQLNDLFSDTSDQSSTDGSAICPPQKPNSSPNLPISHSSAFVKYPNSANNHPQSSSQQQQQNNIDPKLQRISLIAPPTGFDDLTSSDLSSDCTETNSLSRELLTSSSNSNSLIGSNSQTLKVEQREHVLGRRVIIDQNQALGGGEFAPTNETLKLSNGANSRLTATRPLANRSNSMRSASAPKPPERKISSSSSSGSSDFSRGGNNPNNLKPTCKNSNSNDSNQQRGNNNTNNYKNGLNGSNLSLSSIISSTDLEMKRSNSLFDELLSSFEDDANSTSTLPSLISLMRNDASVSILSSTPQQNGVVNGCHQRGIPNGRINCSDDDAELSSPESVKRQECGGKLSADSAYSSLNRKYSHNNGRSTNDVSGNNNRLKLSKFCHECGFKFPDSAKFCCECGVKRLTI